MLNDATIEKLLRTLNVEAVAIPIAGTAAATATNYPPSFFTARVPCKVVGVSVVYGTAASGSGTLDVRKRASGVAIGAGTSILTGTIALNGTVDTPVSGTLNTTNAVLNRGDTLGLVAATTTGLADVNITVWIEPLVPEFRN